MSKQVALIFFGVQGSGKSTQTQATAARYNLAIFETGDRLRKVARGKTELAQEVRRCQEQGKLVDDTIIIKLIDQFLLEIKDEKRAGIIFDGFPRSTSQCSLLADFAQKNLWRVAVVNITVSDKTATQRLSNRVVVVNGHATKRSDDTPDLIAKRLEVFHQTTEPIIATLAKSYPIFLIDGEPQVEKVTEQIFTQLDAFLWQTNN